MSQIITMQNIDELCQLSLESFNNLTYEELDSAYDFIAALTAEPNFKKTYKLSDRKKYILFANKAVARMDELEEEAKNEVSVDMPEDLEEDLEVLDITVCHEDVDQELETSVCPQPEEQKINNAEINMECLSDDEVQINEDKLNKLKTWAQNESVSYTDIDDLVNKYCQADIKAIFNETQKGSESDDADAYVNAVEDKIFGYTREERVCLRAFSYDKIKAEVGIMAMRIETETEFKTFRVDRDNMLRVYRLSDDELRIAEAELRYDDQDAHNIMLRGAQEFIKNGKSIIPCQLWEDPAKPGKKSTKERLPSNYRSMPSFNPTFKEEDNAYLVQTNKQNQIMVLDLDMEKRDSMGKVVSHSGVELYEKLLKKLREKDCDTYTVKSGSGGRHLYFKYDPSVTYHTSMRVGDKKYGWDMIIDDAVFGPGSFHPISKKPYKVIQNKKVLPCPAWLLAYLKVDRLNKDLTPYTDNQVFDENEVADDFCNSRSIAQKLIDIIPHEQFADYGVWKLVSFCLKNAGLTFEDYHIFCLSTPNYTALEDCQRMWNIEQSKREKLRYTVKWLMGFAKRCEESKDEYARVIKEGGLRLIPAPNSIPYYRHPTWENKKLRRETMLSVADGLLFRQTIMSKFYRLVSGGENEIAYYRQVDPINEGWIVVPELEVREQFKGMTVKTVDEEGKPKYIPFYCIQEMTDIYKYADEAEQPLVFWSEKDECVVYNKWVRPAMTAEEILAYKPDKELEEQTKKALTYHIKSVFCGLKGDALNQPSADFDYITKWLAHTLMHPGVRLNTSLVLLGEEGCGKSTLISRIYKVVMGKAFSNFSGDTFTGNGALSTMMDRSLCLVEDMPMNGYNKDSTAKIKALITCDLITCKLMYKNVCDFVNHLNMIWCGNGHGPLGPVVSDTLARRLMTFRCNDEGIPGERDPDNARRKYFMPLYDIDPVYLAKVIIKEWYDPSFIATGFVSESTKQDMETNMSDMCEFIHDEIIQKYQDVVYVKTINGREYNISCAALYKKYMDWFSIKYPENIKTKEGLMNEKQLRDKMIKQNWIESNSKVQQRRMGDNFGDSQGYGKCVGYSLKSLDDMIVNFKRRTNQDVTFDKCSSCQGVGILYPCEKTKTEHCTQCVKAHALNCSCNINTLIPH